MTAMTTSKTSRPNSSDSSVFSRITDNEFVKLQKYRGTSLFYSSLNFGAHLLLAPVALIMNVLWCITSPLFVLIRALSGDLERNKKPDPNKKSELNKLAFFFAFMREFSPIDMIHMLTCGANNKLIKHISPDLDQNKYAKDSLESQMYKFYSEESKNKENVIYYTGHTFAFAFAKTLFIVPRIIIAAAQFIFAGLIVFPTPWF